jgi:hypothetical protein
LAPPLDEELEQALVTAKVRVTAAAVPQRMARFLEFLILITVVWVSSAPTSQLKNSWCCVLDV